MPTESSDSPLNAALRYFEAAEANLEKIERIFGELRLLIPDGIEFGGNVEYDSKCRAFDDVLEALPKIDGWKPLIELLDLNYIAQSRLDGRDIGEIQIEIDLLTGIEAPGRHLAEYRHRLYRKRRQLIRDAMGDLVASIDNALAPLMSSGMAAAMEAPEWDRLRDLRVHRDGQSSGGTCDSARQTTYTIFSHSIGPRREKD